MEQSTREDWVERLVSDQWINLTALADGLQLALSKEVGKIESHTLAVSLINQLADEGDEDWMRSEGNTVFIGMPAMFRHYATWVEAVAGMLGIDCSEHDMADEWVTDAMPQTQAILWALTDVVGEYVAKAGQKRKAECGYTPAEVLLQSLATGESFEQTATRLGRATKGLRSV